MRICFIGDSFVNGTGDDDCLGWVGRICAKARQSGCDLTAYNLGIRRDTSADIAARWQREATLRLPPDHQGRLVFSFGNNDCAFDTPGQTRIPLNDSVASTKLILIAAKAWLPTLMIGPSPVASTDRNERIRHLSGQIEMICGEVGVPFLSPFDVLLQSKVWVREAQEGDGAHPNRGGYSILAELIAKWPPWCAWVDQSVR
jgi:lysophospholipase L1-like esterase